MRKTVFAIFGVAMLVALSGSVNSQGFYNMGGGSYMTGYGKVYGSFGYAMATQNMYNTIQMQIQRSMMRSAMIKKWGLAAVEKAEREAKSGRSSSGSTPASSNPQIKVPPPPVVRNYGVFRPDAAVDTGKVLADALGETAEEKTLVKTIFVNTKTAYEKEAAAKGWKNNIAGGLTFFTVAAMTVYRDAEEPSEQAVNTFFTAVNQSIDELPDFASLPNKDKQSFNNVMIGFGGLLLAGYTEGKQNNDPQTLKLYSQLAGELIKMVLKVEPDRLRIENGMIVL